MPPNSRRLRRVSAIFFSAALVVSSNSATASARDDDAARSSDTVRMITVPVKETLLKVTFDPAAEAPTAVIDFVHADAKSKPFLFLQTDVYPIVARITGCRVADQAPANQLLPHGGPQLVALNCP